MTILITTNNQDYEEVLGLGAWQQIQKIEIITYVLTEHN
jgi:hypothetical protein